MIKSDPHPRPLGSAFDAVLHGVAQGLGSLFPPVQNSHPTQHDEDRQQIAEEHELEPRQD
ncbi:hypothetical protein [Methylobacterium oxalidis]|uniref:hypothetical protein n=1 Tax=Methylobacterium oxalidis TaxID=944322 RepID=UPI003315858F